MMSEGTRGLEFRNDSLSEFFIVLRGPGSHRLHCYFLYTEKRIFQIFRVGYQLTVEEFPDGARFLFEVLQFPSVLLAGDDRSCSSNGPFRGCNRRLAIIQRTERRCSSQM